MLNVRCKVIKYDQQVWIPKFNNIKHTIKYNNPKNRLKLKYFLKII